MEEMIQAFADQLQEALVIGKNARINPPDIDIRNIVFVGMGGSGIGASFVKDFVMDECQVPIELSRGYELPAFANENTLGIISSYSGETEEAITLLRAMEAKGCKIICISSGGKLMDISLRNKHDFILIPSTFPSPRACLGYSIITQLYALHKCSMISEDFKARIESSIAILREESDDIKDRARRIAELMDGSIPVIYTTDRMQAAALRFRQQLNENAKLLCWHNIVPEMNHNELVAWCEDREDLAVIVLRNKDDMIRNQERIDIMKQIISKLSATWIEVYTGGKSRIEHALYLIHLVDWISWYTAKIRKVDVVEIRAIDYLKHELSRTPIVF
jgi:glucose/mannose-6-phosphate isomerase